MLLPLSVCYPTLLRVRRFIGVLSLPIQAWNLASSVGNSTSAEESPLGELPSFNATEEKNRSDDNDGPLPCDHLVLEDDAVDDRNIEGRENGDETENNSPEEELVAADVIDPAQFVSHLLERLVFQICLRHSTVG